MPTGQWWDYALKHIPNLVMVYRETPETIFYKIIEFPEHKSDITRLEAILALGLYTLFCSLNPLLIMISEVKQNEHDFKIFF